MAMHLIFWKLEWKRACQRLPQMFAGATVLLFLAAFGCLFGKRSFVRGCGSRENYCRSGDA